MSRATDVPFGEMVLVALVCAVLSGLIVGTCNRDMTQDTAQRCIAAFRRAASPADSLRVVLADDACAYYVEGPK